jgi:hypothetical protein
MPQRFPQGSSLRPDAGRKSVYCGKSADKAASSRKSAANSPRPPSVDVLSAAHVESLESRTFLSATYFVSTSGNDNNVGSISQPFRTIQRAANVALGGDKVEIRAGTYHEDVVAKHSGSAGKPIVFEAYNNENVVVSGADRVSNWSSYGNSIYKASMPWTLGEGNDAVYVDSKMMNEARWPNTSLDPSHPTLAHASSVSRSGNSITIHDGKLTQGAGYWKGATVHITPGQAWIAQTGTVTNSGPGFVTFNLQVLDSYEVPKAGNAYYITGTFKALDSAAEWYRDSSGALYLRTPGSDSPANHDVEAKHRLYAFDLSGQHDITIHNVGIFSATIKTDSSSHNTVMNGIHAMYVGQFQAYKNGWGVPVNSGIILNGPNSTLENSTIAYSAGDGVFAKGANSLITNNVIHDVDYSASDTAAIHTQAYGIKITHNTIYNAGRSGILHTGASHAQIMYNTIHDVSLQTTEAGGTYTVNTNGGGTVIAYNKIYNIHAGGFGSTGVFLDNNSSSFVVDNNNVSNVDNALKLNYICRNDTIYNNTLYGTQFSISSNKKGDWNGTKIYNNIFNARALVTSGGSVYNNSANSAVGHGAADFASGASGGDGGLVIPAEPPPAPTGRLATSTFQAENWSSQSGVAFDSFSGLGYADGGDWAAYTGINFSGPVKSFTAAVAAPAGHGGTIELHLDSAAGTLIGTLKATPSGNWHNYTSQSTTVSSVSGVHTLYLVFRGATGVANVDWFKFT